MTKAEKQTLVMFAASLRDQIRHEKAAAAHYSAIGNKALAFEHERHAWSLDKAEGFCRDLAAGCASAARVVCDKANVADEPRAGSALPPKPQSLE